MKLNSQKSKLYLLNKIRGLWIKTAELAPDSVGHKYALKSCE